VELATFQPNKQLGKSLAKPGQAKIQQPKAYLIPTLGILLAWAKKHESKKVH
jgi:hypothetical protein